MATFPLLDLGAQLRTPLAPQWTNRLLERHGEAVDLAVGGADVELVGEVIIDGAADGGGAVADLLGVGLRTY